MTKYRFDTIFSPEHVVKKNHLDKKLDLGITEIAIKETWEISTSKNDVSISKLKSYLKEVLEGMRCKVWSIEGGKYE